MIQTSVSILIFDSKGSEKKIPTNFKTVCVQADNVQEICHALTLTDFRNRTEENGFQGHVILTIIFRLIKYKYADTSVT
jgi:hypothetical protein